MDNTSKQVVERLRQANNILVTVRNNPTVDLLSACIALALVLDKMDKHAAAVFSGAVPSVMEFLKPEDTIERTPDSLRDFIIALDKSKADKLRYKVEDKVVRIFITPYKTSLSQDDLEFSQGDFNVDAVIALGAHEQQELDQAITAHGRILHDATVISINNTPNGNLGSMNWQDTRASSIAEMVTHLVKDLGEGMLDEQIATALLTGIVAETERFSNEKTTPETMNVAGELMAAGANQQLVATSLAMPGQPAVMRSVPETTDTNTGDANGTNKSDDGTLDIDHEPAADENETDTLPAAATASERLEPEADEPKTTPGHELLPSVEPPHINNVHSSPLQETPFTAEYADETPTPVRSYLVDEPSLPGNTPKHTINPVEPGNAGPFDMPPVELPSPVLAHDSSGPGAASPAALQPPASAPSIQQQQPASAAPDPNPGSAVASQSSDDDQTLEEIEASVHSPHVGPPAGQPHDLDAARSQVLDALQQTSSPRLDPLVSLNANPLGDDLRSHAAPAEPPPDTAFPPANIGIEVDADGNIKPAADEAAPTAGQPPTADALTPPPPMPPAPFGQSSPLPVPPPGPPPMTPPNFSNSL